MAVVFLEVGQEVYLKAEAWEEAITGRDRLGYTEDTFESVVGDRSGMIRDNTPGVLYYEIVPGDRVNLIQGCQTGSENMSRVFMLKPADGLEGVKNAPILTAVKDAGPMPVLCALSVWYRRLLKCASDGEKSTAAYDRVRAVCGFASFMSMGTCPA